MTLSSTTELHGAQLAWERLMANTAFGRYADSIENMMLAYVLDQCSQPGVLLDIGCEGGRQSQAFASRRWRIVAADVDAKALEICKYRIPDAVCKLVPPDAQQLPVANESVDLVLCIEVGPVIHQPWAAAEFARVLKVGGRLVAVCWNRASWRGFFYHRNPRLRTCGSTPLYGYPIRYRDFKQEMIRHGFQFEKERGYAWGPFRRTSNSRFVSIWSIFERYSGLQNLASISPMIALVCKKACAWRPQH